MIDGGAQNKSTAQKARGLVWIHGVPWALHVTDPEKKRSRKTRKNTLESARPSLKLYKHAPSRVNPSYGEIYHSGQGRNPRLGSDVIFKRGLYRVTRVIR